MWELQDEKCQTTAIRNSNSDSSSNNENANDHNIEANKKGAREPFSEKKSAWI